MNRLSVLFAVIAGMLTGPGASAQAAVPSPTELRVAVQDRSLAAVPDAELDQGILAGEAALLGPGAAEAKPSLVRLLLEKSRRHFLAGTFTRGLAYSSRVAELAPQDPEAVQMHQLMLQAQRAAEIAAATPVPTPTAVPTPTPVPIEKRIIISTGPQVKKIVNDLRGDFHSLEDRIEKEKRSGKLWGLGIGEWMILLLILLMVAVLASLRVQARRQRRIMQFLSDQAAKVIEVPALPAPSDARRTRPRPFRPVRPRSRPVPAPRRKIRKTAGKRRP